MGTSQVAKVTISLPPHLLAYADSLAKGRSVTRSRLISQLLEREEEAEMQESMALGYREMADENRREAEEALNLTSEVILRNEAP